MLELFATIAAAEIGKVVFEQVLKLGQAAAEDYVKDFFKGCLKGGILAAKPEVAKKATAQAVEAFLTLMVDELEDQDISRAEIRDSYEQPMVQFVQDETVKPILGSAFEKDCREINGQTLASTWDRSIFKNQSFPSLPGRFDWARIGNEYLKKVRRIVRETPELRSLLSLELKEQQTTILQQIAGLPVEFDLSRYREAILEQYGALQIESLGSSKYEREGVNYRAISLWQVFVAQNARDCQDYVPSGNIPKEQLRRLQQAGDAQAIAEAEMEKLKEQYRQQTVRSILEIVGITKQSPVVRPMFPYLVILGDPGSGKSTLLRYLAVNWAEQSADTPIPGQIPLLIELRRYTQSRENRECKDFIEFIHQGSNWVGNLDQHRLEEWLKQGKVLAMFDGLDEVVDRQQRGNVLTQIHNFTQRYPSVPAIVTSRVIGYQQEPLRNAGFQHFMLQDLDDLQIAEFLDHWHQLTYSNAADRQHKQTRLQAAIQASRAIQELAGNPLLLTLMAILNRGEELPRDRVRLYEKASEVLLYQWDVEAKLLDDPRLKKYPIEIDYRDKQAMLRRVAYFMQSSDKELAGNFIRRSDLEHCLMEYLKTKKEAQSAPSIAKIMIDQLQERNFILCSLGSDAYAFVHRTFLEYFCATEIKERFDKRGVEGGLCFDDLRDEVFGQHWQDETWHEVLRLLCGEIDAQFAGQLIEWLMTQTIDPADHLEQTLFPDGTFEMGLKPTGVAQLQLATECLAEVRERGAISKVDRDLLARLQQFVQTEYPYRCNQETSDSLLMTVAKTWAENRNGLVWLKTIILPGTDSYFAAASIRAVAVAWKDSPDILPWLKTLAQSNESDDVRRAAVQALAQGWKNDPDTLPILKTLAQSDESDDVQRAAVEALAQGWKNDPDTLPILKTLAQSDESDDVRRAAVQALAQGWKDNPDTLPWLKTLARSDESGDVRRAAVEALAQGWKNDPDTLPILKTLAQFDEEFFVRFTTVKALAQGWKNDPDTLPILKTLAQFDEEIIVRFTTVKALAQSWKDDPDTLSWLKTLAQSDKSDHVRRTAVEALAQSWKDDPDTLPILKTLAQSDESDDVRRAAVQALAQSWKDSPDILPWLKTLAQSDKSDHVRHAAVQALAQGWKNNPDTLPILKTLAQSDKSGDVRHAAVQALAQGWKNNPDTSPWLKTLAQSDKSGDVRHAAVQALARGWKNNPDTLPILKTLAQSDKSGDVRRAAVQALARGWKNNPDTLPILKTLAQSDESGDVRHAAVQALAQGWKNNPDTLPILKTLAQSDESSNVRYAAVQALVRGWKNDPDTLPILKTLAQSDESSNARHAVVQALVRGWKDDPDTLPILKTLAQSDEDNDVRAAVQALVRGWKNDPDTLPILKTLAQSDKSGDVRHVVVQALARGWKDDPDTLPILKTLAQSDKSGDVRHAAVQALARGWKSLPELVEVLSKIAIQDPFERSSDFWESNPRQAALKALLIYFPTHITTIDLLRDRTLNDPDEQLRQWAQQQLEQWKDKPLID